MSCGLLEKDNILGHTMVTMERQNWVRGGLKWSRPSGRHTAIQCGTRWSAERHHLKSFHADRWILHLVANEEELLYLITLKSWNAQIPRITLVPLMWLGCVHGTLLQLCIGNKFKLFKCTGSARGIWANPCITQFMSHWEQKQVAKSA